MTTAYVLSGGASHGSIQVGMAIALEERGIAPDLIVGTSVGAINGAWLAGGRPATGLAELWHGLERADLFPLHPLLGLRAFAGRSTHFVPDAALRSTLSRHLPFDMIEDASTPLIIVAADALSGEEVLLTSGNAVDAVTACASLPAIYPPARVNVGGRERLLVDGAIVNNIAITTAVLATGSAAGSAGTLDFLQSERPVVVPRGWTGGTVLDLGRTPDGGLASIDRSLDATPIVSRRISRVEELAVPGTMSIADLVSAPIPD